MKLSEFLLQLAANPELLEAFNENPDRVADEVGLSHEQRHLLGPGKLEDLRVEVRGELSIDDERAMIQWIHHLPTILWLFDKRHRPDDAA